MLSNQKIDPLALDSAGQIEVLSCLSQKAAGALVGLTGRALRYAKPAPPRNEDKTYNAADLVRWCVERAAGTAAGEDSFMAGEGSPALERYRGERARLAKMERLSKEGNLIPRAELRAILLRHATLYRRFGEKLEAQFGKPAADLHQEFMVDMIREVMAFLGSDEVPDAPEPLPANGARDTAGVVGGVKDHDAKT